MKVRKAIIPAAGLGTRVLPASKSVPKEMLNIVDKPAIQYIVEEAVAAGIEDAIFPIDGTKDNFEIIKMLYEASGAKDNCALVPGDKGHLNYADLIWEKYYEMSVKK